MSLLPDNAAPAASCSDHGSDKAYGLNRAQKTPTPGEDEREQIAVIPVKSERDRRNSEARFSYVDIVSRVLLETLSNIGNFGRKD
jgi:hypothetical protein